MTFNFSKILSITGISLSSYSTLRIDKSVILCNLHISLVIIQLLLYFKKLFGNNFRLIEKVKDNTEDSYITMEEE